MKYSIEGEPLPVVICELEANEKMITEKGAMSWMSPNMKMETVGGGAGKMFGRMFSGESMFVNHYTAEGGPGMIAFASTFGVEISVFLQKKIGSGLFGGEGFIMQKLSGKGVVFVEFDGYIKEYELSAGQSIVVDTGYLAAMDASCSLEIQKVPGVKNMLFGGEGVFNTVIKGPGRIWLQSMPIGQMAGSLIPYLPSGK